VKPPRPTGHPSTGGELFPSCGGSGVVPKKCTKLARMQYMPKASIALSLAYSTILCVLCGKILNHKGHKEYTKSTK